MSNVSYLQRYSQRENHITNNTLLVLRHFYRVSPRKFENILSDLIEDSNELSIGPFFNQQERMKNSIPDAVIYQAPLSIYIEAKLGENIDREQFSRHLKSIQESRIQHSQSILLTLTTRSIDHGIIDELREKYAITLASTTYKDVVDSLEKNCEEYELELNEILQDYRDFISDEGLLPTDILTAFPCGDTIKENKKHQIYFQPSYRRSKKESKFIGLYKNKEISCIGKISTVVTGTKKEGGEFTVQEIERGEFSSKQRDRLNEAIKDCHQHYGAFAEREEHRYYLFEEMSETEFKKESKGGMLNLRNFDLSEYIKDYKQEYSTEEVAKKLRELTWE